MPSYLYDYNQLVHNPRLARATLAALTRQRVILPETKVVGYRIHTVNEILYTIIGKDFRKEFNLNLNKAWLSFMADSKHKRVNFQLADQTDKMWGIAGTVGKLEKNNSLGGWISNYLLTVLYENAQIKFEDLKRLERSTIILFKHTGLIMPHIFEKQENEFMNLEYKPQYRIDNQKTRFPKKGKE